MLRRVAVLALLFLAAGSQGFGQEWARKMFKQTDHDFGYVARSSKAEYAFELQNLYLEDVHIASVRSSCGCTSPRIAKELLKTYEKGAIIAKVNTPAFTGQRGATVTVTIDRPYYAEVQLHVRAYIRGDVVVSPGAVRLGSVEQGSPAEAKVAVSYAGRDDWKVLDVRSPNPHLSARAVETGRGGGRVSYDLVVKLDADAPAGYIDDHLLLVTNDGRASQVPVEVEGRVLSSVTVTPASLFMGVVQPGQQVTKQLVIKGRKPFRVLSVTCEDESFRFDTSAEGEAKVLHIIPVTFVAGSDGGKVIKKIRIETDLEDARPELAAFAVVATP